MKTIGDYTINCTPEQTKKALELGAQIERDGFEDRPYVYIDGAYLIPTAEQMIGWLEEQDGIKDITVCKTGMWIWGKNHTLIEGGSTYSSRQESTLAAIDAALEYLTNNKRK